MKRALLLSVILAVYLATHASNPTIVRVRQWMINLALRAGGSDSAFAHRDKVVDAVSKAERTLANQPGKR